MANVSNGKNGLMPGRLRFESGGNVSMPSSNDALSKISAGEQNYGPQMITNKFKDGNSIRGGLSDATSNNDMVIDG